MNKSRIWELDALRGIAIIWVVIVHFLYDLRMFFGIDLLSHGLIHPIWLHISKVFIVLSGLCVTLGKSSLRRGTIVFGAGMLITVVTWAMVKLGFAAEDIFIRFGILHLLGACMLLWPVFRRLPWWLLAVLGAVFIAIGARFSGMTVENGWLFPLGLCRGDFYSGDYFPLFPHLGWFLLGTALGKTLYRKKKSFFPRVTPPKFLCACGRRSLLIYLLHQPILYGITAITASLI